MMPGMNPKMLKQAMKQLGVKEEEIEAEEVIIRTKDKDLIIKNPGVTKVKMMGQESLQITGEIEEQPRLNLEDVRLVMEQAKVSEPEAKSAIEKSKGDIAEAILLLSGETKH